jgi:hypothetical protein
MMKYRRRMRRAHPAWILIGLLIGASQVVIAGQRPKYGATVQVTKAADLAKAKTYAWTPGQPSADKTVDAQIMAAVDRELTALGFTKLASGPSDVLVTYRSLSRTDVDLKSTSAKGGEPREYLVGTLVVDILEPANRQSLFRVRMDTPIDTDRAKLEAEINAAVTAMFEKYPTRTAVK